MDKLDDYYDYYCYNQNKHVVENRKKIHKVCNSIKKSNELLHTIFHHIDKLYFNGTIAKELIKKNKQIKFELNKKFTSTLGRIKFVNNCCYCMVSSKFLKSSIKNVLVNGIVAEDNIYACIITLEQQVLALVINLIGTVDKYTNNKLKHNIFQHKDINHEIYNGDYYKSQQIKKDFLLYSYVKCNSGTGILVEKYKRNAVVKLDNGKCVMTTYQELVFIHKDYIKQIEDIKSNLYIGSIVRINNLKLKVKKLSKLTFFAININNLKQRYICKYWSLLE